MEFIGKSKKSLKQLLEQQQQQEGERSNRGSSLKRLANKYTKQMSEAVNSGNIASVVATILQDKEFFELDRKMPNEVSKEEGRRDSCTLNFESTLLVSGETTIVIFCPFFFPNALNTTETILTIPPTITTMIITAQELNTPLIHFPW